MDHLLFNQIRLRLGSQRTLVVVAVVALVVLVFAGASASSNPESAGFWEVLSSGLRQQPLVLCFLIIGCGMGFGSIRMAGLSFGTSGVLFAGLLFGHLGRHESWTLPAGLDKLGLVLFVYAVGLGAGPTFFRAFRTQGRQLAFLGIATVVVGATTVSGLAWAFKLPAELATGLFAGSLTSTPALASGIHSAQEVAKDTTAVSIGFGIAYPIGVIGVVLFVQLLPRLLRIDMAGLGEELQSRIGGQSRIGRFLVRISNPAMFGKSLHQIPALDRLSGQITRVQQGDQLVPITPEHVFAEGQTVLLVTDSDTADVLTMILGVPTKANVLINADRDRAEVVVTSPQMMHKKLRELHLMSRYGVTIAHIERYGVDFVPNGNTTFCMADRATVVGEPEGLKAFERAAGHRKRRVHETDLMSLGFGLVVGIVLGMIPIEIPGVGRITLGLAGGPLLAGLLFAHFGRFMGIVGHMPIAARMLTQSIGLALFLAYAGFQAGNRIVAMITLYGMKPIWMSLAVTAVCLIVGYVFSRRVLRMDFMQTVGGMCGAMTSTAGIGVVATKTDCDVPVTSYAAAYPAALVMMTIVAQLLIRVLP